MSPPEGRALKLSVHLVHDLWPDLTACLLVTPANAHRWSDNPRVITCRACQRIAAVALAPR